MSEPRAYTKEEARSFFISKMRNIAEYWSSNAGTDKERITGAIFSVLCVLDGATDLPAFDIVLSPHEDDKQFLIDSGENFFEPKMAINDDAQLHELFINR